MGSTLYSAKIPLNRDIFNALKTSERSLFKLFRDPSLRPPILEEMMDELQRVIVKVAQKYTDVTTPHLHFDELVAEGNAKLAELINAGALDRLKTRKDFFSYFKAAVCNHTCSRVQKYRFTEKRTGQKPPPRKQRLELINAVASAKADGEEVSDYHKPVDLSLDDEELGLQVPDTEHVDDSSERDIEWGFSSISAEYAYFLTPVERLVFHEMIAPSAHARVYAELDASRKSERGKHKIKIKFEHMALAVGLTSALFEEAVLSIRNKIKNHRMATDKDQENSARRSAVMAQLKELFGLQIPPDIDEMVVRRMLTIAAHHQYEKLTPQVNELLEEVHAKVPQKLGGNRLACYGVLFQRNCRPCTVCDLRHGCSTETANAGLSGIVQSQRLLGYRMARTPVFMPGSGAVDTARAATIDDEEIITLLYETFQVTETDGQTFFRHKDSALAGKMLFCLEQRSPLKLRFCGPSVSLREKLVSRQRSYYPKDGASLAEIVDLIEQHSSETLE